MTTVRDGSSGRGPRRRSRRGVLALALAGALPGALAGACSADPSADYALTLDSMKTSGLADPQAAPAASAQTASAPAMSAAAAMRALATRRCPDITLAKATLHWDPARPC